MSILVLGSGQASALPPGSPPVQSGPPGSEQRPQEDGGAPLADLYQILDATRAKLEELTEATALVAADANRRKQVEALKQDNERLAAELQQANARRTELESSGDHAAARIAELTKSVDAARLESARLNDDLARLRQQNEQLSQNLARADAAHGAAVAETEKIRAETAKRLKVAADEVDQSKVELASRQEQLETIRRELAKANGVREQVEARVTAMEKDVERSRAQADQLKTELAQAKEQLDQTAGAAVAAERARQAAVSEAEALRDDAERARQQQAAAQTETARLKTANAGLEKQIASLQTDSRSATETARSNLTMMGEKIQALHAALELARTDDAAPTRGPQAKPMTGPSAGFKTVNLELEKPMDSSANSKSATGGAQPDPTVTKERVEERNAALDPAPHEEAAPTRGPQAEPVATENARRAPLQSPSGTVQPPAPESAGSAAADQPADGATKLSMVEPTATPSEADSRLTSFRAKIEALNELERKTGGGDLFSGVESVVASEVHVGTTAGWDTLPPVGKQSYLGSLLDAWLAAQGGKGPATVQIVDRSGQVLVEKSSP